VAVAAGGTAAFVAWAVTASVDWMWESTAVTAAGLSAGVLAANIGGRAFEPIRAWVRGGAAVLILLALAIQLPLLAATERVRDSQRAVTAGNLPRAVENATTAVEAEPWAATPLLQRALVLEATGNLAEASTDARAAADREPTNWRVWLTLARIEAQRGHVTRALRAGGRARRLNPKSRLWTMPTPRSAR
jgi:tetratricopeptide (TPR) repeat protein